MTLRFSAEPAHQLRRAGRPPRSALASSVAPRAGRAAAHRAACRCGTSAASAPARRRRAASVALARLAVGALERVGHRQRQQAADARRRGRRRSARRSIRRAPGSAPRRAPAPSRRRARRARRSSAGRRRRVAARVAPPQRATARRGPGGQRGQRVEVRRRRARATTSDAAQASAPRASAASVCATSGRPAISTYCLGRPAPARTPLPAHGTSANRRAAGRRGRHRRRRSSGGEPKDKPRRSAPPVAPPKIGLLSRLARHAFAAFMLLPDIAPGKRFTLPRPPGSADALLLARFAEQEHARGQLTLAIFSAEPADAQRLADEIAVLRAATCASPSSPTGRRCPTTASRRTRT